MNYEYDSYMRDGASWERTASNRASNGDYLGARDAYFNAADCYSSAASIAWEAGDTWASNSANREAESARRAASDMVYEYDRKVKEYTM